MPAVREIVNRQWAERLPTFFPGRVRIEAMTTLPRNSLGEELPDDWTIIYDNVPAAVMAVIRLGEEWRNWRLEFVLEQVSHRISLQGYFPLIKANHRMIDLATGSVHNITAVHVSSYLRLTRINTRVVDPEAIEGI